ncbi:MAG: hypothetical protein LBQ18_05345 [Campylobacteraceae bacterium]|jgi:hypothetical protein|nr:hypothetical protein [Campylobacteraceae bacterium]
MKKVSFLLLVVVGIMFSGCFGNSPIVGFRDMKWGEPIEKLGNHTIISDNKTSKEVIATKKDELLKIGEVDLRSIEYRFFDNQFYWTEIKYDEFSKGNETLHNRSNNNKILQTIKKKYGTSFFDYEDTYSESYTSGYRMEGDKIVENIEYRSYSKAFPSFLYITRGGGKLNTSCYKNSECSMIIKSSKLSKLAAEPAEKIRLEAERQAKEKEQAKLKEAAKDL